MGDMGEFWKDVGPGMRQDSQAKRASNREWSANYLTEQAIPFRTNNGGEHLIIEWEGRRADFWPGTGKWIIKPHGSRGRVESCGVKGLVRNLRQMVAKAGA